MNILITDNVDENMLSGLKNLGMDTSYLPNIQLEELPAHIGNYDGIIINSKIKMTAEMIDLGAKLRFIARLGSGMEIIDLEHARKRNIAVFSAPEGNRNAVAEHALGMLLASINKLHRSNLEVRQKIWNREANRGMELEGKTMGIIGFGHTGSSFAKVLSGFDIRILAYDKYKERYSQGFEKVTETNLDEILENADFISLHLPLTDETHHLVDKSFLARWKNPLGLINTSRGAIVNTKDLVDTLEAGKLKFACLDVFENEKPETYNEDELSIYERLFVLPNVTLSPHIAGWSYESKRKIAETLLVKIDQWKANIDAIH